MADSAGGASDYNTEIIKEFRANQGRVGGMWTGTTLILIHHMSPSGPDHPAVPGAHPDAPAVSYKPWLEVR